MYAGNLKNLCCMSLNMEKLFPFSEVCVSHLLELHFMQCVIIGRVSFKILNGLLGCDKAETSHFLTW